MPGKFNSMVYSWDIGPVHFISFSTEFYYFLEYGIKPLIQQFEFIEKDLKVVSHFFRDSGSGIGICNPGTENPYFSHIVCYSSSKSLKF
jgi:hypothetical protein